MVEQLSCELDGPFVRRPPEHRLCDIEPIFGQLHRFDEVLPVPEIERRAGIAGRRIEQVAVRSDQRELNHVAAGHLRFLGPEFQAEGGRILRVKRARDQQRLIDPFEYPLGIFLKQFGDTVSVRPRLLQRFRPFRRRDRKIADPHQRQEEQRDLQRGISQDCFCGLADQSAGVNHGCAIPRRPEPQSDALGTWQRRQI